MFSNYIDMKIEPGKGLFQYEVKFSPDIDSTGLRRKLLNQHVDTLGRTRTFDGMILYLPKKLSQDVSLSSLIKVLLIQYVYNIIRCIIVKFSDYSVKIGTSNGWFNSDSDNYLQKETINK